MSGKKAGKKLEKKRGEKEELKIIWEPSSKRRQARPSALPSSHFLPIFHSVFPFAVGKFNQRQAFNAIEVTRQCNLSQFAACNMPHLAAAGNLLPYLSARFVAFAFAVSYCWCLSHCLSVCLSFCLPGPQSSAIMAGAGIHCGCSCTLTPLTDPYFPLCLISCWTI